MTKSDVAGLAALAVLPAIWLALSARTVR